MPKNKIDPLDQIKLEFMYKSFDDGVNILKAIDLKCQLMMAFIGITLVPLFESYEKLTYKDVTFIDKLLLISVLISIILLLLVIKEKFHDSQNLTSNKDLQLFFPKKYDRAMTVDKYYKEQSDQLKKASINNLIDNMVYEKLKFQREFYKKITQFRLAILAMGIYFVLLLIKFLPLKEMCC